MASPDLLIAKGIAAGRAVYGLAAMAAPRKMLGASGARAEGPPIWMMRTFGVRDLVLGAGTFVALTKDVRTAIPWVEVGAAADALDVVNGAVFRNELDQQGRIGVIAIALPAAAGGIWAARRLRATYA